jgi:hypothetical protein
MRIFTKVQIDTWIILTFFKKILVLDVDVTFTLERDGGLLF